MYEPYKNSKTVTTHQVFWRLHVYYYYHILYCCSGAKNNNVNAFLWAKNTARGVRFLLGFNMYLFLAQCEQVYLFLALAHFIVVFF